MAIRRYSAARTTGSPGTWTVTRSTTDTLGTGVAALVFDDSKVLSKVVLTELFKDILHKISRDFGTVSSPASLHGAFDDEALFSGGTAFADQGAVYTATIAANNAHTIARADVDDSGSLIDSTAMAVAFHGGVNKIEVRSAINAISCALSRDAMAASKPASYPTSGSVVV